MLRKLILIPVFLMFLMISPVLLSSHAFAGTDTACTGSSGGFLGFPTWYKYLDYKFDTKTQECKVNVPGGVVNAGGPILLAVFEMMLRAAGLVSVVFVMWGGIQYQLSQGEPDRVSKARTIILNSLIGLAITISATVIVNLVAGSLS